MLKGTVMGATLVKRTPATTVRQEVLLNYDYDGDVLDLHIERIKGGGSGDWTHVGYMLIRKHGTSLHGIYVVLVDDETDTHGRWMKLMSEAALPFWYGCPRRILDAADSPTALYGPADSPGSAAAMADGWRKYCRKA